MNINEMLKSCSGVPTIQEHKHSGHEALMSGGANACPICQAFEIAGLKAKLVEAEACCAENRELLLDVELALRSDSRRNLYLRCYKAATSAICGQRILDEQQRLRKALEFYADESKWRVAEASEAFKIGDVEIGAGEPFMGFNDGEDHPWSVAAEALAPAPEERS